ncbi:IS21-like element helper ATPase IstB [Planctomycetota bacterium]
MKDAITTTLKQLRLSGLVTSLDVRLQEAQSNRLNHEEFLELILQDEVNIRQERRIKRRIKIAAFRDLKTLEDFNFSFNPSVKRKQIYDLGSGQYLRQGKDILFLGPPGVGKSHLVQALGYQAIKLGFTVLYRSIFDLVREFLRDETFAGEDKILAKYLKTDLLIIDDMGMKGLPKKSGEYLFEIIMRRHETRATIMTSNRPIQDWGKLLGDVPAATAILDRFLQHADIIEITGKSYRLKDRTSNEKTAKQQIQKNGNKKNVDKK